MTKLEHARTWVWVWVCGEPPAFSIGYEKPLGPADSGFTVLFEDAPDPADVAQNGEHPAINVMCLGYVLEEHPELGRGLDLALEYGVADLDESGAWVVGDLGRLSPA